MHCPSCGAISENANCCDDLLLGINETQELPDEATIQTHEVLMNSAIDRQTQPETKKSTLIEFPGVNRNSVPEWRKELSERVREIQERKARDAARDAVAIELHETQPTDAPPQLELLPPTEMPAMNPLVAAALRRIERAHQTSAPDKRQHRNAYATAVAYAPAREENEPEVLSSITPDLVFESEVETQLSVETEALHQIEKSHNLVVVPAVELPEPETKKAQPVPVPKRLIVDDPNDPALNYLDSITRTIRVDEIDTRRPAAFRRLIGGIIDLIICALLAAPIGFAMWMTGTNLRDPRAIEVLAGSLVVVTFIYLTLMTALTGRTWGMRLLSLRVIDIKTGLIPTGGQSLGRSFLYLISLALAGLGILYALISRDGYTFHDRATRTAVILT